MILGSIGSHYRRISTAKILQDNGKSYTELMRIYHMNSDFVAKKLMNSARNCSEPFLRRVSELVMETDRGLKTSVDSAQRLMELLILQLSQEARND